MKFLRFFLFISLCAVSCNTNKGECVPALITIDGYVLNTEGPNSTDQFGSAYHNITDARLSVNGEFIGIFELPVTVPVLAEGSAEISITAGIKNFGIASDRQPYKLVENFELTTTLVPEENIILTPELKFFEELVLQSASEDFSDQSSTNFTITTGSFDSIEDLTLDSSPLEDIVVGQFTHEDGILQIATDQPFPIVNEGPTFLEFDYLTNQNFLVGLKTGNDESDKTFLLGINPNNDEQGNPEWNRIYLNLEPYIDFLYSTGFINFNIFFQNELGSDNLVLKLDNVKVISLAP